MSFFRRKKAEPVPAPAPTPAPAAEAREPPPLARSASSLDDYECPVCKDLLFDPVTMACGHTCCQRCLVNWLRVRNECPAGCSTVIPSTVPKVTIFLKNLLAQKFPEEYEERRKEAEAADKAAHARGVHAPAHAPAAVPAAVPAAPIPRAAIAPAAVDLRWEFAFRWGFEWVGQWWGQGHMRGKAGLLCLVLAACVLGRAGVFLGAGPAVALVVASASGDLAPPLFPLVSPVENYPASPLTSGSESSPRSPGLWSKGEVLDALEREGLYHCCASSFVANHVDGAMLLRLLPNDLASDRFDLIHDDQIRLTSLIERLQGRTSGTGSSSSSRSSSSGSSSSSSSSNDVSSASAGGDTDRDDSSSDTAEDIRLRDLDFRTFRNLARKQSSVHVLGFALCPRATLVFVCAKLFCSQWSLWALMCVVLLSFVSPHILIAAFWSTFLLKNPFLVFVLMLDCVCQIRSALDVNKTVMALAGWYLFFPIIPRFVCEAVLYLCLAFCAIRAGRGYVAWPAPLA